MTRTPKTKARPSIMADLAAEGPGKLRALVFTPEQRAEIDEVLAAEREGKIVCGAARLARVLKARYDLPWAVATIRDRILEIKAAT